MILTTSKIQTAIIKAWYSIALKAVKYYGGLAVGINNSCLLKQIRLLRAYVEILRNFKIVGSTITCSCCIEGDYKFNQNVDVDSLSGIQFNSDNTGVFYTNDILNTFSWSYSNGNLILQLDNDELINYTGVSFTTECNIEFTDQTGSFILEAPVEINNTAMFGGGSLTQEFLVNNVRIYIHNGVYIDYDEFINDFNTNNIFGYSIEYVSGDSIIVYGPYGSETFEINYFNPSYENDGGNFSDISSIDSGFFINDNPCEETTAEQECLTNKQVSDIINHINKLVK
jgi:hypothetical protein